MGPVNIREPLPHRIWLKILKREDSWIDTRTTPVCCFQHHSELSPDDSMLITLPVRFDPELGIGAFQHPRVNLCTRRLLTKISLDKDVYDWDCDSANAVSLYQSLLLRALVSNGAVWFRNSPKCSFHNPTPTFPGQHQCPFAQEAFLEVVIEYLTVFWLNAPSLLAHLDCPVLSGILFCNLTPSLLGGDPLTAVHLPLLKCTEHTVTDQMIQVKHELLT